jgi:hypothetical protein
MLACIFTLIIFVPIALLPLALTGFFSPDDLSEMGIDVDPYSCSHYPFG